MTIHAFAGQQLHHNALVAELIDRTRRVQRPCSNGAVLEMLTASIVDLGVADWAGITERLGRNTFQTLAPTNELVGALDVLQDHCAEGPYVQAAYDWSCLHSNDLAGDQRWPRWGAGAAEHGVKAMISVNLHASGLPIGMLNLYRSTAQQYAGKDLELAEVIGAHASILLDHHRSETHLWNAIDARHRVGQAQGMLMERFHLDADKAFKVLRRLSQQQHTKLHVIAERLTSSGRLPEELHAEPDLADFGPGLATLEAGRQ
ncbi:MAG: GAF and ANTAR domain-containing protein [Actinomycetota bacterium]|nr:GAF and ANTAR domain-containing protein [Actinomycetota bacterium]